MVIDGHDVSQILEALQRVEYSSRPLAVIAQTIKGKGIPFAEDLNGWHGKALTKGQAERVIKVLSPEAISGITIEVPAPEHLSRTGFPASLSKNAAPLSELNYLWGREMFYPKSIWKRFGGSLGKSLPGLVVLDGDVENSTYTESFAKAYPARFVECYISEGRSLESPWAWLPVERFRFHRPSPLSIVGHWIRSEWEGFLMRI